MSLHKRIAKRVSGLIVDYLLALPLGCVAALAWANTWPESYYTFSHGAAFFVNDIGMVFFFALIGKEVVEATLPDGALHPWRKAAVPMIAAVGGVAISIAVYIAFEHYVGEHMLEDGWIAACAVDIPGTYVVARLIFGREPAVPFLLLLAISADILGLAGIAVLQSIDAAHLLEGVALMTVAIIAANMMRHRGVKNFWLYLAGPGLLAWAALFVADVQPALALVPIVPFFPHARRDAGLFVEPTPHMHDTLSEFDRWWRLPVEAVLFAFGLVNAGFPLHGLEAGSLGIPIAALARPFGIVAATSLAVAAGLHLPHRVHSRDIIVVGCIATIGLVFALFFAAASMPAGALLLEQKMGALVTVFGSVVAFAAARVLCVGRFAGPPR